MSKRFPTTKCNRFVNRVCLVGQYSGIKETTFCVFIVDILDFLEADHGSIWPIVLGRIGHPHFHHSL